MCPNTSLVIRSNLLNTTWSNGVNSQQITIDTGGIYWAIYRDSCNTYTDTIEISNYLPPAKLVITGDTSVCPGSVITTYSNNPATTWQDGSISDSMVSPVSVNTIIEASITNKCLPGGKDMATRNIEVIQETFSITASKTTICKDTAELSTNQSATNWILPDSSSVTGNLVLAFVPGLYKAGLQGKCIQLSDSIEILEFCLEFCNVYVPNAFTPNGDGTNDVFLPIFDCDNISTYNFTIFNRWGEVVFETNDPIIPWDGNAFGQPAPLDSYSWIVSVENNNEASRLKGVVNLLR